MRAIFTSESAANSGCGGPCSKDRALTLTRGGISLGLVLRCAGRIATLFALCCAIGLHWIALQSFAWTTMIIDCSKRAPLRAAITQTLDGSHPCSLCHAVDSGKNSEKKSDLQSPAPKIDMIYAPRTTSLTPPFVRFAYPKVSFAFSASARSPLVPPPRLLLS
jgi:hypothetical protein